MYGWVWKGDGGRNDAGNADRNPGSQGRRGARESVHESVHMLPIPPYAGIRWCGSGARTVRFRGTAGSASTLVAGPTFSASMRHRAVKRLLSLAMLCGVALFAAVLYHKDVGDAWLHLQRLGWVGLAVVLAISFIGLGLQAASWALLVPSVPASLKWWCRFGRVLMIGSAVEMTTPLSTLGGDSVKAIVLKRRYGVSWREASASLLLSHTTDVLSIVAFVALAVLLMVRRDRLPRAYQTSAIITLTFFALAVGVFIGMQWQRPFGRLKRWLADGRRQDRHPPTRIHRILGALRDVEDHLHAFYRAHPRRVALSIAASFAEWSTRVVATYVALALLGAPVTFADAFVIEGLVLLVCSTLFFMPGDVGTQDAALVMTSSAITGSPAAGLALAAVRRLRDLAVVTCGFGLGAAHWTGAARTVEEGEPAAKPATDAA